MFKNLLRRLRRPAFKQPHDSVQSGPLLARLWVNHDRINGKRYVGFSLHRVATVKGSKRRVNAYGPKDIAGFLGLICSLCDWYLRDGSTSAETARELRAVLDLLGELAEPRKSVKAKGAANGVSLEK